MSGELGKASLDLEANLGPFERNVASAKGTSEGLEHSLEALASIADVAKSALNDVKLSGTHAAESRVSAEAILSGVRGISEESLAAAHELDRVKLTETQAVETEASGALIDHVLNSISRNADEAKRKLLEVKLAGGRTGVGVGPFGSGFGRVGVLGAAIGVGALTAPAAGPAAIGLLASIPTLAAAGAGALGTLVLAFQGVGKAIGGDKKAFDDLTSAQKQFVLTVRSLDGWFDKLKQTAAQSLFPGLTKGLKAALSPGTVNAIDTAVVQLGHALGQAGAQWGKYFGSHEFQSVFGPLMKSAARNIGVMSDAFLHLFDALGVLARAAIPFTNWLTDSIDKGAKFADTWLHAQDATGRLAGAMREARSSLTLVAKLAGSLLKVIFALGEALYPVAKIAVKDLTSGLDALSGIIHRNQGDIRAIVGGALKVFVEAVKATATGIGVLWHGLESFIGHKATIIAAIAAIGIALALSLGPEAAAITGAIIAIGEIKKHWGTIKKFFVTLGLEILHAFEWLWYQIERGALIAALKIVEPFSHLPGFLGGWARKAKDSMQSALDKLHAPDMNWSDNAARAGEITGQTWADAYEATIAARLAKAKKQGGVVLHRSGVYVPPVGSHHTHHHHTAPKPGTHAWYMQNLGYDPTQGNVFGSQPPFTKNLGSSSGSGSVIPAAVSHLLDLASQQASMASAAKTVAKERQHLRKEIADLDQAEHDLEAKLKHATGKQRTQLFHALTSVENKIRDARKKLQSAISGPDRLDFALDKAKLAVEKAKQGSKAWDAAVAAEEKALRAEIRYWDKRAHNSKLSAAARDAALKKELGYQKQLNALLKPIKQAAAANEAEFLQAFNDIQGTFAPNAVPDTGNGKTNTHLYDIKNEARQTNRHLAALRGGTRFPASAAGAAAATAVGA